MKVVTTIYKPRLKQISAELYRLEALGTTELDEYCVKRAERLEQIEGDAYGLASWTEDQKLRLKAAKQESRDERRSESVFLFLELHPTALLIVTRDSIERRFRALGDWTDADFDYEWKGLPLVKDFKPLTERGELSPVDDQAPTDACLN